MTFFANSGVAWPNSYQTTREAGQRALEAGAYLWHFLGILEGRDPAAPGPVDNEERLIAANMLKEVSMRYYDIADKEIGDMLVPELSPAEMELANIPQQRWFDYRGTRYPYEYPYPGIGRPVPVRELYRDLALRLQTLSSHLSSLESRQAKEDLAGQAFLLMGQWEAVAILARIIAVLNRRQPERR
jgi:hypothetical protein